MLSKNFKRNNKEDSLQDTVYDLDRLNILREKIIKYITEFGNEINYSMTAKEIIEKIYNHLIERNLREICLYHTIYNSIYWNSTCTKYLFKILSKYHSVFNIFI